MAVYQKLLLSAGGGIVSTKQQADQARDTATLLIGLGGTGIDCIRTIKTEVRSRLKPDNPDAVVPQYDHIRFLGVDTDVKTQGKQADKDSENKAGVRLPLDDTEFFSIANPNLRQLLSKEESITIRDELSWLRYKDIPIPDLTDRGAGGVRQVGRLMMMDRSSEFMGRIEQEINAAKRGLKDPTIYVHIFTGLSGGTGAGSFLDVCYMTRHIADRVGAVTVLGYFFLPDVNLANIPEKDTQTRQYVPLNGYASMQELDYCMNLQYNGGSFVQEYQGRERIAWNKPPVDVAHLICATDSKNNVIHRAYDYAMSVTAEYVMDFLTQPVDDKFGLASQISNYSNKFRTADSTKRIGSNLNYCAIGASCASLPLRQINTYLASELFEKFSTIGGNTPGRGDVDALATRALVKYGNKAAQIYDSLWMEVNEGVNTFRPYPDDWKFVRDYGNSQFVEWYADQQAAMSGRVETNAESMADEKNTTSIIAKVRSVLVDIIRDINRGPVFAYGLLSASAGYNLSNAMDGIIKENQERKVQEAAQSELRTRNYENAKRDFENKKRRSLLDSNESRFQDYEKALEQLYKHYYLMGTYEKIDWMLKKVKEQIEEASTSYYLKLSRVTQNLIETFKENRDALKSESVLQNESAFEQPLMTIQELKKPMDAEIEAIDVPNMLDSFMSLLLNNQDEWIQEDENKIKRLVTSFFVETAFAGFAGRSITAFLRDKYDTLTDDELSNCIYDDWMSQLTIDARPRFYFDSSVWKESEASKVAFISVPEASAPVKAAAKKVADIDPSWEVKASALTDRIFIMGTAAALPLSAYSKNTDYERQAFSSPGAGRYYYETANLGDMPFSDWRKLPPLTPQRLIQLKSAPQAMKDIVEPAQALFDEAVKHGVIDDENKLCALSQDSIGEINELCQKAQELSDALARPDQLTEAEKVLSELTAHKEPHFVATDHGMQNDGDNSKAETRMNVAKDHFVSSPAYQIEVRRTLDEVAAINERIDEACTVLSEKIYKVGKGAQERETFFDALFTGVISIDGFMVKYVQKQGSITIKEHILSKKGLEFPLNSIPVYQAYSTYQELPDNVKEGIAKASSERSQQELVEAAERLKTTLSDEKAAAWSLVAANYPESQDICEFLAKLMQGRDAYLINLG